MGIVDRIVDGIVTWVEIFEHNIAQMDSIIARERANKHDPKSCHRKYCKHGTKRAVKELTDHRAKLVRELRVIKAGVVPTDI